MSKHIVAWMQRRGGRGAPAMRVVANVLQVGDTDPTYTSATTPEGSVGYLDTDGAAGAAVFDFDVAVAVCQQIRRLYGENQYLHILAAEPGQGEWTQARLDEFLPAYAWSEKYGQKAAG